MKDQGIGSWARRRAVMSGDRVALREGGDGLTYAELDRRVDRLAAGLRARGVRRGDRVAFLGLNSISLVETLLAAARLGAVFLPLNTRLAPVETASILAHASPRILLWDKSFDDVVGSPEVQAEKVTAVEVAPADGTPYGGLPAGSGAPIDEQVSLDDLLMVQYTSGTSGRPKGVRLTHGNITWNVYNLLVDLDLRQDEVALVTAPLFHTAALNQLLLPTLLKGGTALIEPRFEPERAIDLIEQEGVTFLFGVTSMFLALSQSPRFAVADLSRLRTVIGGGSPFPRSLLETYRDRGLMIIQGYGLTETSPGATMLRAPDGLRKLGSAGTACFFTDVRVVTPDLVPVAPGETGEVLVRGPNVSAGYWQDEQATAEAFVDGDWLRTGDLARLDADGFIYIVDRLKDMYISGGENVYPAEVEQAVYTHPAVAECAVIGVPDPAWGEVGRAVVALRPGEGLDEQALIDHLSGRLARYKIPKSVRFVEELPHTASGKLRRADVRVEHGE